LRNIYGAVACSLFALLALSTGCAHYGQNCVSGTKKGHFCHHGLDFGTNISGDYTQGVIDGCSTAEGYFIKDYNRSSNSSEYRLGWEKGRARCRQKIKKDDRAQIYTVYEQSVKQKRASGRIGNYSESIEKIDL